MNLLVRINPPLLISLSPSPPFHFGHIPSPRHCNFHSTTATQTQKSATFSQRIKAQTGDLTGSVWPKPGEILYEPTRRNLVNLIGYVKIPVHFDGEQFASFILVKDDTSSVSIPVVFNGDLAHSVACHVKENDLVSVSGRVSKENYKLCVVAENLDFVKRVGIENDSEKNGERVHKRKENGAKLYLWRNLVHNPSMWWDYRAHKANGLVDKNYPDFKKKSPKGEALWMNAAPEWVLSGIQGLVFDVKDLVEKREDSWKDLVENPDEWWDNRLKKRNPRAPDFLHKWTREALWLSSCPEPEWVLSKLKGLPRRP